MNKEHFLEKSISKIIISSWWKSDNKIILKAARERGLFSDINNWLLNNNYRIIYPVWKSRIFFLFFNNKDKNKDNLRKTKTREFKTSRLL